MIAPAWRGSDRSAQAQCPNTLTFLAFLSARFSIAVFAGFFLSAFFESIPLDMMRTPLTGDVRSGIHLSLRPRSFIIARFAHRQPETMPDTHFSRLDEPLWPLMNKFYRAHQSSMKAVRDAQLWVARRDDIVGALCLRPVSGGHWLTGLFVDPACREQGIAAALITAAVKDCEWPVWLFCHPDLRGFYERRGFTFDPSMPFAMVERLSRYARSKPMIAMGLEPRVNHPRSDRDPGTSRR